jgi:hypothetical protein
MPDGNRLLVPIDGSDHSLRALAQAIKRVRARRMLHRKAVKAEILVRVGVGACAGNRSAVGMLSGPRIASNTYKP